MLKNCIHTSGEITFAGTPTFLRSRLCLGSKTQSLGANFGYGISNGAKFTPILHIYHELNPFFFVSSLTHLQIITMIFPYRILSRFEQTNQRDSKKKKITRADNTSWKAQSSSQNNLNQWWMMNDDIVLPPVLLLSSINQFNIHCVLPLNSQLLRWPGLTAKFS